MKIIFRSGDGKKVLELESNIIPRAGELISIEGLKETSIYKVGYKVGDSVMVAIVMLNHDYEELQAGNEI